MNTDNHIEWLPLLIAAVLIGAWVTSEIVYAIVIIGSRVCARVGNRLVKPL